MQGTDAGRFVLRELRQRNICRRIFQINWILVIVSMPGQCELIDIKGITSSRVVATSVDAEVGFGHGIRMTGLGV